MNSVIHICHRCTRRQRPCAGRCVCLVDGQDVLEHAATAYCPLGRYRLGMGDLLARGLHVTRLARLAVLWREMTGRECRCGQRQGELNGRWAGMWQWIIGWGMDEIWGRDQAASKAA